MSRGGHRGIARPDGVDDPLVATALGDSLTGGCTNQPRTVGVTGTLAMAASGSMALSYFKVPRVFTAANMAYYTTATAAGATPSLIKYALFSVAANGDLTRIAVTASDTALFAAGNTRYSKALSVAVGLVPGQLYASGLLLVTAAALPTLLTPNALSPTSTALSQAPRLCGIVAAQTDILTGYTAAQVTNNGSRHFAEITT